MRPARGCDDCWVDDEAPRIYTCVRWKWKPDLPELRCETVKRPFKIQGAALCAYRFVR
ncbi:MAG TPA: hypothetical protein P5186_13150 [Candidatus Paceibacterota bacterium]|nr:hypothetical protein [Verrucomicrobiota bacterium]HRY48988.1 hypothetical protein [Candidatus Paceibacterota bacterium]HSA00796.1 hypothetical protein [Candidatus Paceibacterota bacterium]